MIMQTNDIKNEVKKLFEQKALKDKIDLLSDNDLDTSNDADKFILRGNAWYDIAEYDKAINDYDKAIELNGKYAYLALYNKALAFIAKGIYTNAINDFKETIKLKPEFASAYVALGSIYRAQKKYVEAIKEYDKAIKIDSRYTNAYFNRGLAKKESQKLEESKKDFRKYLKLTTDTNDLWNKYANYYIKEIDIKINDKELTDIKQLIEKIKRILLEKESITHYTSLSVLKNLILDNEKFRISEANFMNDPSEGNAFFSFLEYNYITSSNNDTESKKFYSKPFIGSFIKNDKNDDLNMWRFYGKENGEEATGCSITLPIKDFIKRINKSLPKGEEDFVKYESDINFYKVVYIEKNGDLRFLIPGQIDCHKLEILMNKLKEKIKSYKGFNKIYLNEYLNGIAFLFKCDSYKNENEIRLVVNGLEFNKEYNKNIMPPRVFIELESIKDIIERITLGPKVNKANEWASAFHYSYENKAPEIIISHLPYK